MATGITNRIQPQQIGLKVYDSSIPSIVKRGGEIGLVAILSVAAIFATHGLAIAFGISAAGTLIHALKVNPMDSKDDRKKVVNKISRLKFKEFVEKYYSHQPLVLEYNLLEKKGKTKEEMCFYYNSFFHVSQNYKTNPDQFLASHGNKLVHQALEDIAKENSSFSKEPHTPIGNPQTPKEPFQVPSPTRKVNEKPPTPKEPSQAPVSRVEVNERAEESIVKNTSSSDEESAPTKVSSSKSSRRNSLVGKKLKKKRESSDGTNKKANGDKKPTKKGVRRLSISKGNKKKSKPKTKELNDTSIATGSVEKTSNPVEKLASLAHVLKASKTPASVDAPQSLKKKIQELEKPSVKSSAPEQLTPNVVSFEQKPEALMQVMPDSTSQNLDDTQKILMPEQMPRENNTSNEQLTTSLVSPDENPQITYPVQSPSKGVWGQAKKWLVGIVKETTESEGYLKGQEDELNDL